MTVVFPKSGDILADRFPHLRAQHFDMRQPRIQQIVYSLRSSTEGLSEIGTRIGMELAKLSDKFRIESSHVGKASRRLKIEYADEFIIPAELFVLRIARQAKACTQNGERRLA